MTFKVVMTLARYPGIPRDEEAYHRMGAEFIRTSCKTEEEIRAATQQADVVVTALQPYTRKVIENMENCRLISAIGIGYEGVDVEAASQRGILVANVPGYCVEEVSDHALALLLACHRKLFPLVKAVREGKWDSIEKPHIRYNIMPGLHRLQGQTLGIIGLGRIGRALVPKARAFGLRVLAYDPYATPTPDLGVEMVSLTELLLQSDFISLHAALSPHNQKLIGLRELKTMKPTAYVINTARGGLVDEEALLLALREGYIAGAALDVTSPEPPRPENPLLHMDKVIISAHTAQYSEEALAELRQGVEDNIFSVLRGELPPGLVNPQALPKYKERFLQP